MMFCYTECRLCSTYCAFQAMTKKSDKCISSATKNCLERDRDDGLQIAYFVQIFDLKNVALLILLLSDLNISVVSKKVQLVRNHIGLKVLDCFATKHECWRKNVA